MKEPADIKLPEKFEDLLTCFGLFLLLAAFKWIDMWTEDDEKPVANIAAPVGLPERTELDRTIQFRKAARNETRPS